MYADCVAGSDFAYVLEIADLRQAGMVGMLEALRCYDPAKGAWSAFASRRVRGEMIDRLRRQGMVSLPQERYNQVRQLKTARTDLRQRGTDPSATASVAAALGWSEQQVQAVDGSRVRLEHLDRPVLRDGGGGARIEQMPGHDPGPEKRTAQSHLAARIQECLEELTTDDERLVLRLRFLEQEVGLKKIAGLIGVTAQRVHQIEKKALGRMKSCFNSKGISLKDME